MRCPFENTHWTQHFNLQPPARGGTLLIFFVRDEEQVFGSIVDPVVQQAALEDFDEVFISSKFNQFRRKHIKLFLLASKVWRITELILTPSALH